MITQSGALGSEFVRMAPDYGLRMSKVISYGNGYVLDCTDYLEYFENDPETRFIGMYLEGVRDGRKLLDMVKRINPKKPVVILKGGLTSAGAKAAASHTGSLAGQNAIWDAFFAQSGAIRVDSIEEMVDVLQALVRLPPCTGRGAMIIGTAGGNGVIATDICAREGLEVPDMSEEMQAELREFVGVAGTSVRNPMDVGMQLSGPDDFFHVLEVVQKDPNVDLIFMIGMIFPRRLGWWGGARNSAEGAHQVREEAAPAAVHHRHAPPLGATGDREGPPLGDGATRQGADPRVQDGRARRPRPVQVHRLLSTAGGDGPSPSLVDH